MPGSVLHAQEMKPEGIPIDTGMPAPGLRGTVGIPMQILFNHDHEWWFQTVTMTRIVKTCEESRPKVSDK